MDFQIADLEILYSRSIDLPIYLEESRNLAKEISSAKVHIIGTSVVIKVPSAGK